MKQLFTSIINVQLGASIAICILLLSYSLLKRRYVAKLRYWLWLALAVRLLIPVDINVQLNRQAPVTIPVQEYYVSVQQPVQEGEATQFEFITAQQLNIQEENIDDTTMQVQQVKHISITDMVYHFWFIVAAALLGISFLSYLLAKRDILSTAVYDEDLSRYINKIKRDMGIESHVSLAVCSYTGSPMLMGISKPVVVLPDTDYTHTELEMILRHELTHLQRRDILYKMLLHIVACVYWFNPLMHFMAKYAGQDIEFSCDEDTVKNRDKDFKAAYARTIVKVITMQNNRLILATTFSQSAQTVKERFTNIFCGRKLKKGRNILAAFMAVLIIATTMVGCSTANKISSLSDAIENLYEKEIIDIGLPKEDFRLVHGINDHGDQMDYRNNSFYKKEYYFNNIVDNGTKYGNSFTAHIDKKGKMEFVCDKENCTHNTTQCNAYRGEGGWYFTVDDKLYMLDTYRTLYSVDKAGAKVRLEISENYNSQFINTFADSSNIYLNAYDNEQHLYKILQIDMNSFDYRETAVLPQNSYINEILTITDKNYVVFDGLISGQQGVFAISTDNGECHKIREPLGYEVAFGEQYYNGAIYGVDRENNAIVWTRLNSNDKNILLNVSDLNVGQVNRLAGIIDKYILFTVVDNEEYIGTYMADTENGSVREFSPVSTKDGGGFINPAHVVAEIGDMYIIALDYTSPYQATLAMITKEDYFNNIGNVLPIVTTRLW